MVEIPKPQKAVLLSLAARYDERLYRILVRGREDEVCIGSDGDAAALESFADAIVDKVGTDFPDHEGADADINHDAQLAVVLASRLISRYATEKGLR